jgi:hypothetical protein
MIVASAPGFGTAFTAYFPAEPNSADAPTAAR